MEIIQLFDKYIGPSKTLKKNEYAYHCPFCHHHKPKLQINDKTHKFHCWTCNAGGNLMYLGKRIGMSELDLTDLYSRCGISEEVRKKLAEDWSGSIKELLDKIIQYGLQRADNQKKTQYTFDSGLLSRPAGR